MKRLRWLWRETLIPSVVAMVLCVGGVGYLIVSGHSPADVTAAQASAVAPIAVVLVVLVGHSLWSRWSDGRAVREIRRNQQRRGES